MRVEHYGEPMAGSGSPLPHVAFAEAADPDEDEEDGGDDENCPAPVLAPDLTLAEAP